MEQIILIVHLLLALAIIGLVMLQQGKGADMGASFGAGASQTLFGSDGSGNVLTRATAWLAALFFASSFGLAIIATQKTRAVDEVELILPTSVVGQQAADGAAFDAAAESDLPQVDMDTPVIVSDDAPGVPEDIPQP